MSPEEEHYFFGEGQHEGSGCGPFLLAVLVALGLLVLVLLFR